MTVPNDVTEGSLTCTSCEYRYSLTTGVCPMCGTEPLRPLSALPNKSSLVDHGAAPSSKDGQQAPARLGLWRLIPVVVVLIALVAVTSFVYKNRKGRIANQSMAPGELAATSAHVKQENTAERHIVHPPVGRVQHLVAAKLETADTIDVAKEADPVELWKAVRHGSVSAEVALANLYLAGDTVPQNCEQAHMLLSAASVKGSKTANDLLKSSYAERCE